MIIQWFPGHMRKTLVDIEKNLKFANVIIYCLDARIPISSLNPEINEIVKNKPIIYLLNKADLANEMETKKFAEKFKAEGKTVLITNANSQTCKQSITKALNSAFSYKQEQFSKKGVNGMLRAMVIGVPNTGKSTIINVLSGAKKAVTGDKAGVTRNISWIKVDSNIEIMDTPGTLWPKFENFEIARNLAIVGSIKNEVLDESELGFECLKLLIEIAPNQLIDRYNLQFKTDEMKNIEPIEIYDKICINRGWILRKNEIDYERAGKGILDDFRSGKLGKITLDKI